LTKTIIKGQQNTSVNGGQFITFDGKKCFESDKYGKNVGNGSLVYDAENSRVNGATDKPCGEMVYGC
jgi:hypothetical protein